MKIRLPAEWEKQEMVLMAFPHQYTDWANDLTSAYSIFVRIASAICYKQKLLLLIPDDDKERIKNMFCYHDRISFISYQTNDTWIRDFGPISIYHEKQRVLKDFTFNGWGGKFEASLDNQATKYIHKGYHFGLSELKESQLVLEGGSIDSDGIGTILTTTSCLKKRFTGKNTNQIETILKEELGANRVLWLEHGYLSGDDTDGHIDMLARFVSRETIVYMTCSDEKDEHFKELVLMKKELEAFKTSEGKAYNLIPLPLPKAIYKDDIRLPASYVNFLIINNSILLPIYKDESDKMVIEIFENLFPSREIIPLDSRRLIEEGGSIHCSTMQVAVAVEP